MLAGRANAQWVSVSPQKQVSPEGVPWQEVAASGSLSDYRLLLVGSNHNVPVVTTNATLAAPTFHPGPQLIGGDSFTTTYTTFNGRIYIGAVVGASSGSSGPRFTYYDPGQGAAWSANPITVISNDGITDKPWLAIGSSSIPFGEINYYVMSMHGGGCDSEKVWVYRASISSLFSSLGENSVVPVDPAVSMCESTPTCNYRGWGSMPMVTDDGEIVAVVRDSDVQDGAPGCYNERRPYVIWSNDDGYSWLPGNSVPILLGSGLVESIGVKVPENAISDTPFYVDRRNNAPSIAIDRAANTIYVAFAGRRDTDHSAQADWNSDIWIFRGTKNFQTNGWEFGILPGDFFHLTDEMLGLTPNTDGKGPDQFMPAIAVDCAGAINLMFYDNRAEAQAPIIPDEGNSNGRPLDVYYARIRNWPNGTPDVYTKRLTPATITVYESDFFFGDYHTIAAGGDQGKWFYPVYISKKNGVRTCYAHSVFIRECLSDLNMNRAADGGDVSLFWDAFYEADPTADVNNDGFVNSEDVDEFVEVYSDMLGG